VESAKKATLSVEKHEFDDLGRGQGIFEALSTEPSVTGQSE
jgi:hypothetical protein